jgi:formylglycine-generating enzyme required for sulfatase activity
MGKNWAITIGINQYDNLTPLNYAKSDAEAMRDFCLQEMGFEQVYYFSDDSEAIASDNGPPLKSQPTFATLSRFLRTRFEQPFLDAGDNLWFFFAGHGKRERDRDYLMPIDVDPGNLDRTAISLNYITERLRRCGADNVILFLDACRDEGARDGEGIGLKQQGVITLFSCSPNERSYEIEALQQGAFTHALLQGLRVQGEGNCATVERLYDYLKHQVPELNRKHQKPRQTPYAIAEPMTKLHIILLPKQARLKDVDTLKKDALTAEVQKLFQDSKKLWVRVLAVSPADSDAIEAIERLAKKVEQQKLIERNPKRQIDKKSVLVRRQFLQKFIQFMGLGGVGSGGVLLTQRLMTSRPNDPTVPSGGASLNVPSPKASPSKPELQSFNFEVVTVNAQGKEIKRQPGQANFFAEDLGNGVTLEMVSIPSGSFLMGSPKREKKRSDVEGPLHSETVSEFFIGKYPITQAQWKAVAAFTKVNQWLNPEPAKFIGPDRPVEQVLWEDADEFCRRLEQQTKLHYRLPKEAEWEYACRARTTTPFHFGETLTPDLANYDGNYTYAFGPKGESRLATTNVGIFLPNAFGLYDMHGNVWEWCKDLWKNYEPPSYGSGWRDKHNSRPHTLRGGSWGFMPSWCRSASRSDNPHGYASNGIGFRVVCEVLRTL